MFLNYVIIFITLIVDIRNDILRKDDKYSFFIKVGGSSVITPSNIKQFIERLSVTF